MTASDRTVWGIHAGKSGVAHSLFLKTNVVALGWDEIGDLRAVANSREAFKAVAAAYPLKKAGAIPNNAGQLFRFVHELEIGDLVAYPSKAERLIHIGRVTAGTTLHASQTEWDCISGSRKRSYTG
ncbi:MAG: hypothetical protein ACT4OZ_16900 [Gemmatimonadota bacterium]